MNGLEPLIEQPKPHTFFVSFLVFFTTFIQCVNVICARARLFYYRFPRRKFTPPVEYHAPTSNLSSSKTLFFSSFFNCPRERWFCLLISFRFLRRRKMMRVFFRGCSQLYRQVMASWEPFALSSAQLRSPWVMNGIRSVRFIISGGSLLSTSRHSRPRGRRWW